MTAGLRQAVPETGGEGGKCGESNQFRGAECKGSAKKQERPGGSAKLGGAQAGLQGKPLPRQNLGVVGWEREIVL